tara:strand:+ start:496 stop:909 length:414 start_codon:yes stop_codon:yes gene_type:complete
MYRPLPNELTIKNSEIEGLGLFTKSKIKKNSFIGITHIRDELFEGKYIRTPMGGFYNHSENANVMKLVTDVLPKLNFGETINLEKKIEKINNGSNTRENLYYNLNEKPEARYMFLIAIRDIEPNEELVANYTLYSFK